MSTFVLIHGGFHGAWCWHKVVAALERKGHTVLAPDLPSHGRDRTPLAEVNMQAYTDCVCKILDAQREPVILVGHSMGGGPITTAAEARPDKIKRLVYVTAILPQSGETLSGVFMQDAESTVAANFVMSEDGSYATFREAGLRDTFYHDCSDEDIVLARLSLTPQAMAPLADPMHTSAERFGRVPRVYIECRRDQALSPAYQKKLYTATPCEKVISMDTSHSPFLSAPEALAGHLVAL